MSSKEIKMMGGLLLELQEIIDTLNIHSIQVSLLFRIP